MASVKNQQEIDHHTKLQDAPGLIVANQPGTMHIPSWQIQGRGEKKNSLSLLVKILAVRGPISGTLGAIEAWFGGQGVGAVVNSSMSTHIKSSTNTIYYLFSFHSEHSAFSSARIGNIKSEPTARVAA